MLSFVKTRAEAIEWLSNAEGAWYGNLLLRAGYRPEGLTLSRANSAASFAQQAAELRRAQSVAFERAQHEGRGASGRVAADGMAAAVRAANLRSRCDQMVGAGASQVLANPGIPPLDIAMTRVSLACSRPLRVVFTSHPGKEPGYDQGEVELRLELDTGENLFDLDNDELRRCLACSPSTLERHAEQLAQRLSFNAKSFLQGVVEIQPNMAYETDQKRQVALVSIEPIATVAEHQAVSTASTRQPALKLALTGR